ncbi:hypothetical protein ACEPAG_9527 [Sanghuangporus baumii]
MTDNLTIFLRNLSTSIRFNTLSDSILSRTYIEDEDIRTVDLQNSYLHIAHEDFDPREVTFTSIWDLFDYVSQARRSISLERSAFRAPDEIGGKRTARIFPRDILNLVSDQLWQDRVPLGVAAMEPRWDCAFALSGHDLRNMSLVHRSWTSPAQSALCQRAVVPFVRMKHFLLSPFCGPWVAEMILYWSINDTIGGVTQSDISLLEELLKRTPNLKSLSFNTFLVHAPFRIDSCLEIIAEQLSHLQDLWLKDFEVVGKETRLHLPSIEMHDLCLHLPKMRSLKFLSLRHCGARDGSPSDLEQHPPSSLKNIEIDTSIFAIGPLFPWLVKPRGNFALNSLSLVLRDIGGSFWPSQIRECLENGLKETLNLRLCILNSQRHLLYESMSWPTPYSNLLRNNSVLVTLDLFIMETGVGESGTMDADSLQNTLNFECMRLPASLERLAIHYFDGALRRRFTRTRAVAQDMFSQIQRVLNFLDAWADFVEDLRPTVPLKFLQDIEKVMSSLPNLRKFVITGSPEIAEKNLAKWDTDGFMNHMNQRAGEIQDGVPEKLQQICVDKNIELVCLKNAFPRQWDVPA